MNAAKDDQSPIEAKLVDSPKKESVAKSRGAVFAILFLVTGVLGIPLLWMNDKFSHAERIFWSIIVTLYTAALIYMAYAVCMWSYHQIFGA
ncbi:hypothetical protein CA13_42340 [Planctomycetes bacterium CA13]|uniref:Uncharacterized protein n=1 Tax=Novipirellula herctigrandis TaxID=2527986 RepID=A0A5C5Z7I0_9BACT|nr:hypothetical protein CA13_42340 [Planctomycetes bacterium CA13]